MGRFRGRSPICDDREIRSPAGPSVTGCGSLGVRGSGAFTAGTLATDAFSGGAFAAGVVVAGPFSSGVSTAGLGAAGGLTPGAGVVEVSVASLKAISAERPARLLVLESVFGARESSVTCCFCGGSDEEIASRDNSAAFPGSSSATSRGGRSSLSDSATDRSACDVVLLARFGVVPAAESQPTSVRLQNRTAQTSIAPHRISSQHFFSKNTLRNNVS